MTEIERIDDQLKRAFEGDAWHGPSVKEVLDGVTARQAASRPLDEAHTIWEIVRHLAAWNSTVRRRVQGETLVEPEEGDWPPVDGSDESAWKDTLVHLENSYRELRKAIAGVSESRLDEPVMVGSSTVYATLQGNVQHNLYHAGQIALLKKVVS